MSKILITGNGFDLSLGLPTSYIDFIKILDFIKENNEKEINFENIYSKTNEKTYEVILNNYKSFDFDFQKIKILKDELIENLWFNFFSEELKIETWIDFENKIEYVLEILFSSIDMIEDNNFLKTGSIRKNNSLYTPPELFNSNYELIGVLQKFNIILTSEFGSAILNPIFLLEKYGYYSRVDKDKISRELVENLNQFKKIFNLYFEIFVFPFYTNQKKPFPLLFENIDRHLTFNYTPSFEKLYLNKTTEYIHGKIDSEKSNIVLGINEIPDTKINKKYFIPFTKYFQKINNDTNNFKFITNSGVISTYEKYFFFGHSLDSSDKEYLNEIFDYVRGKSYSQIIIIYHNEDSKSKLLINLLYIRGKKNIQELMNSDNLIFLHIDSSDLKWLLDSD